MYLGILSFIGHAAPARGSPCAALGAVPPPAGEPRARAGPSSPARSPDRVGVRRGSAPPVPLLAVSSDLAPGPGACFQGKPQHCPEPHAMFFGPVKWLILTWGSWGESRTSEATGLPPHPGPPSSRTAAGQRRFPSVLIFNISNILPAGAPTTAVCLQEHKLK